MIYHILHAGQLAIHKNRSRLWLELGQPVIIGQRHVLTVMQNQQDGETQLVMYIDVEGKSYKAAVPAGYHMNIKLNGVASLRVIPRATEINHQGAVQRLLVEFVRTHPSLEFTL